MKKKIEQLFMDLKFKGMLEVLEEHLALAEKNGLSIYEVIYNLLAEELRFRQERSMIYRLQIAKLPWQWTLNPFPFDLQPGIQKSRIMTLAGLDFISRRENIVLHGKTGVGKTGPAVGIFRQAIIAGYRGRFYFENTR